MLYLGFPFYLIQRKQVVVQKGEMYRATAPLIQPQESYRGIYLPVNLPEEAEVSFPVRQGQRVFVELQQNNQSLGIKKIARKRPQTDAYLKATIRYRQDDLVFLDFPASAQTVYFTPTEMEKWEDLYKVNTETPALTPPTLGVALHVYRGRGVADQVLTAGTER